MKKKHLLCISKYKIENKEDFEIIFNGLLDEKKSYHEPIDIERAKEETKKEMNEQKKVFRTDNLQSFFEKI